MHVRTTPIEVLVDGSYAHSMSQSNGWLTEYRHAQSREDNSCDFGSWLFGPPPAVHLATWEPDRRRTG